MFDIDMVLTAGPVSIDDSMITGSSRVDISSEISVRDIRVASVPRIDPTIVRREHRSQ